MAKQLVPKNKSKFRLVDDRDSDNWNDYKMHGQKVTIYDDKLLFRDTGVVFTLKGDLLSMIIAYDFIKTNSPEPKQIINFLDKTHFDTHSQAAKSSGDNNLINNYRKKRALLASSLQEVIFLSENPNKLCDRLRLIFQKKQTGNDANKNDSDIFAINDKVLEYKCITPAQHKKLLKQFNLL